MDIRILGRLEVDDGTGPVEIRRPKERALLTLLAARVGEVVSAERLLDGLWGERLPATATKTLHTYIHHLRTLLPPDTIVTDGSGYRLAIPPEAVDVHRFIQAVSDAHELLREAPAAAAELLAGALAMWRGRPAVDADEAERIRPLQTRLEALRIQATSDSVDAQLRLGGHEAVIPQLRGLVEEHPLREDLWAHLILALYRSGRQAEALRAFGAARSRLAEELGIEPGPELRMLEQRVLAQDPSLDVGGSGPTAMETAAVEAAGEPGQAQTAPGLRLATLVLAELDGEGALDTAVSAGTALQIRREAIDAIERAVAELGGSVLRRTAAGVLASFGTPIAREDDTYRALRAALVVRSEIGAQGREIERSWGVGGISVRAAVQTRPVAATPVDDDLDGLYEQLAVLADTAGGGEIVVDDHTKRLVGELFSWDADPRRAHGTAAWRIRGVRAGSGKARMGRRLRSPLFGRDAELATAGGALAALGRGVGGVLLLVGDAGVGKTRLVDELRTSPPADGRLWLVGHCAPYAEAIPYWPIRDLLRSWLDLGVDDTELKTRVALHQRLEDVDAATAPDRFPYLGGLLGVTHEAGVDARPQIAPEALQFRTFEVVRDVFRNLAQQRRLVVTIEDIHWADPTSLQLLERLVPLTESDALLLILTSRVAPDHPSHRLTELVRRRIPHLVTEMALPTLETDAQAAMLGALVGLDTLPEAMARRLLALAEGNPFYLEELIGSLIDEGALVPLETGWRFDHDVALSVPETVEKVVQARIDRLESGAHDLVTCAAVLGRRFGLPLLQGVVGETETVLDAVHELLRLELLVEARRWPQAEYVFKHALIQEAAYRTLPAERRAALHRSAAEWLERRHLGGEDEVAGLLARHWAAAGDEERAVGALMRAGDVARRDHALDEAIEHYRTLVPLLERRGDRRTVAIVRFKLALALHTALRFAESNDEYQRAFDLWEPDAPGAATEVLRYAGAVLFRPADPVRSYFLADMQLQMALFDRLVERWPDDTLVPSLAERWEVSDDGLRYRFTLRRNLAWSDGQRLTAHDAAFGVLRNLDATRPGISVAMLYVIEGAKNAVLGGGHLDDVGIRVIDDHTIEFRLIAPAPYFLSMLNRPDCGPQPRHAIERLGEEWSASANEVVSGAFHRSEHGDDRLVLERRAGYAGARSGNVQTVEWRPEPVADAIAAYLDGRRDLLWISAGSTGEGLEQLPEEEVFLEPPAGLTYLALDHRNPSFRDVRLRLGLAHGIDRAALRAVLPAHATAASGGIVPPALAGHTPDIAPRFDPERARELCAAAGAPSPFQIGVIDRSDLFFAGLVEALAEMWRDHLGLDVEVVRLERDAFDGLSRDAWPSVLISYWYPGYTDPEYFLRLLLHSEAADNLGEFAHPPYDALIARASQARDERTRLALFHAADRMAVEEQVAAIPLAYTQNISVRSPAVHGWWEFGKSWSNFADLTVDRTTPRR